MTKRQYGETQSLEAPEIDLAAQAPEFHQQVSDGIQVQNGVGPELLRSREPGIVVCPQYLPEAVHKDFSDVVGEQPWNATYFGFMWFTIVSISLVIAVALGVGLGVGLRKGSIVYSGTSGDSNSTIPSNPTSALNSTPLASPTPHILTQGAMNDTSLAAVLTSDGNRHVFLQDINGTLRHAIFSSVANQWLREVDYLLPSRPAALPRLGTPITAMYPWASNLNWILLYYVNVNSSLSAIPYFVPGGTLLGDVLDGSIAIKPASRCLSAATVHRSTDDEIQETLLFFEAPSGQVTFYYGQMTFLSAGDWRDMTEVLNAALWRKMGGERASLGCPCTANPLQTWNNTNPTTIQAAFFNPDFLANVSAPFATGFDFTNLTGAGNLNITRDDSVVMSDAYDGTGFEPPPREAGIGNALQSSDIIIPFRHDNNGDVFPVGLGVVVNETLQLADNLALSPRFPFSRLAWLTSNASSLYIYHQINESTLAEEENILGTGWVTRLISVSTD